MNEPKIPKDVLREMTKYFMKTSVPRLIEQRQREAEENDKRINHEVGSA